MSYRTCGLWMAVPVGQVLNNQALAQNCKVTLGATGDLRTNATSHRSLGLSEASRYYYRLRATNAGGRSEYSEVATVTTPPSPHAPPTELSLRTISSTEIAVTWVDRAGNESGFQIERCMGVNCSDYRQVSSTASNTISYQDGGLNPGTSYAYRVRATNEGGSSTYSNSATATTFPLPPPAPLNLVAGSVSQSEINLTWLDNAATETGFEVLRCQGGGCTAFSVIATVGANVTSFRSTGLSRRTTYSYQIRAVNQSGKSPVSNTATAATK